MVTYFILELHCKFQNIKFLINWNKRSKVSNSWYNVSALNWIWHLITKEFYIRYVISSPALHLRYKISSPALHLRYKIGLWFSLHDFQCCDIKLKTVALLINHRKRMLSLYKCRVSIPVNLRTRLIVPNSQMHYKWITLAALRKIIYIYIII